MPSKGEALVAFNKEQFRELITDVLTEADLYSDSAVELLMLTCAVESNFGTYIKQINGPALGVFQMEPNTHKDIWTNYLKFKSGLRNAFVGYSPDKLREDLRYAILMTRVHYLRAPKPLPEADDVEGLANYWKRYYNTRLGKGTPEKAIKKYEEYCV
jgi:hypothetical protein